MTVELAIPRKDSEPLMVPMEQGENLFVLGANGTGKSGLMQYLYAQSPSTRRWIFAHRQNWFESGLPDLTPQSRGDSENNIRQWNRSPQSRWKEIGAGSRANVAIFDLIKKQGDQNSVIANAVRNNRSDCAERFVRENQDPLALLSDLFRYANLPITFSIGEDGTVLAIKDGAVPYSVAELSDGERSTLLLAAEVVTVPSGTLILIDEPERHLHRSIIAPLLTQLFSQRSDCQFLVATHEVMLPFDVPHSRVLLIRSCNYQNGSIADWSIDLVDSGGIVDEEIRKDILGARRKIVFVEGKENSLDKPLYSLVLPNVSIIAKGTSRDVEHAVRSIRASDQLHWLQAFGVVDNDGKDPSDIEELKQNGVYAVDVYTVESIYYAPNIQEKVAQRLTEAVGGDPEILLEQAKTGAIDAVESALDHLSERAAETKLRKRFLEHLPNRKKADLSEHIHVDLDSPSILEAERQELAKAIRRKDLATIIQHYPVRESEVLPRIAKALGFKNRSKYEEAVLTLLKDDNETLRYVRELLGGLSGVALND